MDEFEKNIVEEAEFAIEELISQIPDVKADTLPLKTTVFNKYGDKLGKIERVEWAISASNTYTMPTSFKFHYYVNNGHGAFSCDKSAIFTKQQVLKIMDDKIRKIRKICETGKSTFYNMDAEFEKTELDNYFDKKFY